jgi:hypothetical protein
MLLIHLFLNIAIVLALALGVAIRVYFHFVKEHKTDREPDTEPDTDTEETAEKEYQMAIWLRGELLGVLEMVPGIDKTVAIQLNHIGIYTTFQLLGEYMKMKTKNITHEEHAIRYCKWLNQLNIKGLRANWVTSAISWAAISRMPRLLDP